MNEDTEIGDLCREIGWRMGDLGDHVGVNNRTARAWAEYTEDAHGTRQSGQKPPAGLLEWLRGVAGYLRANPPPDWRTREASSRTDEAAD